MPYKDPNDPRRKPNRNRARFIRRSQLKQEGLCRECRLPSMGKTLCRDCYDRLYVKRGEGPLNWFQGKKAEALQSWNGGHDRRWNGKWSTVLHWALVMHNDANPEAI